MYKNNWGIVAYCLPLEYNPKFSDDISLPKINISNFVFRFTNKLVDKTFIL